MATISASILIDKPLEEVWDYAVDHHNAVKWIFGLVRYEPVGGGRAQGVGARIDMAIRLGPSTQESIIEYVEWVDHEVMTYTSVSGFKNTTATRFARQGDGTTVTLDGELTLPGGIAGRVLGKTIEPAAKLTATQTLKQLKAQLESA